MKHPEEKITAFLLKNTKTKTRTQNLYEVALQIDRLKKKEGNLNNIKNKYADISTNMLNRFLSILKVDPQVLELVKQNKIDNINAIYYMHTLNGNDQIYLSHLLINKKINSTDIRALRPLMKQFPKKRIEELIELVLNSKDVKNYLIKFDLENATQITRIEKQLSEFLKSDDYKIKKEKNIGTIVLTSLGIKKLRMIAKEKNIPFKSLMIELTSK